MNQLQTQNCTEKCLSISTKLNTNSKTDGIKLELKKKGLKILKFTKAT